MSGLMKILNQSTEHVAAFSRHHTTTTFLQCDKNKPERERDKLRSWQMFSKDVQHQVRRSTIYGQEVRPTTMFCSLSGSPSQLVHMCTGTGFLPLLHFTMFDIFTIKPKVRYTSKSCWKAIKLAQTTHCPWNLSDFWSFSWIGTAAPCFIWFLLGLLRLTVLNSSQNSVILQSISWMMGETWFKQPALAVLTDAFLLTPEQKPVLGSSPF